ncbi:MAG: protein-glutamate O-methyltransferase CheR [Thermodesulfobacteriota bacterium]
MTDRDFRRLSSFISERCGIKLPPAKKTMLEGRLRKRLRALGLSDFGEYCEYIFSRNHLDPEYLHMIDAVTTNKTDFLREPQHFAYLAQRAIPHLLEVYGLGLKSRLNVWSAGCSTGEEPYSLAMCLSEFASNVMSIDFQILATDISTKVLDSARRAIYEHEKVEPIPPPWRQKYLLRSKDRKKGLVRIAPELRDLVKFQHLNLMADDFGQKVPQAVIFCRNVLIYFNRPTQLMVLNRFCRHLTKGGFLFVGHSETLHGLDLPLIQAAPTIYQKIS